jgi:V-type H+-transporting ATPase subunit a
MFGDAGHGLLLLLLAIYFILNEKELGSGPINEMVQTAFDGRYVVFLSTHIQDRSA